MSDNTAAQGSMWTTNKRIIQTNGFVKRYCFKPVRVRAAIWIKHKVTSFTESIIANSIARNHVLFHRQKWFLAAFRRLGFSHLLLKLFAFFFFPQNLSFYNIHTGGPAVSSLGPGVQGHLKGTFFNERRDFLHPSSSTSERGQRGAFPEALCLTPSPVSADLQSEATPTTSIESSGASCELRAPTMLGFFATNMFHSHAG